MWPDMVSNPGSLALESDALHGPAVWKRLHAAISQTFGRLMNRDPDPEKSEFTYWYNRELNYLRKIICLRKSEISFERITVL